MDLALAIISILLVAIAGICDAVKDTLNYHFEQSIFSKLNGDFWDARTSWANKYKDVVSLRPKFLGSTTIFSWVTDGWHLFQMLCFSSFVAAIVIYEPIVTFNSSFVTMLVNFLILKAVFSLSFELFYSKIFIKK